MLFGHAEHADDYIVNLADFQSVAIFDNIWIDVAGDQEEMLVVRSAVGGKQTLHAVSTGYIVRGHLDEGLAELNCVKFICHVVVGFVGRFAPPRWLVIKIFLRVC